MLKFLILVSMSYLLSSCGHMQSGQYVQISKGANLDFYAKKYGVQKSKIKLANPRAGFNKGEWIFVPLERGILRAVSSYNYAKNFATGHFLWPVPASKKVTSLYGPRWGRNHNGVDIAAPRGTHILSIDDGVVIYSGRGLRGFGNLIVLKHREGIYSIYAHNSKNYVNKGEQVSRGEVIGKVGSSGKATGPHLHFEIRRKDEALDPLAFYNSSTYKVYAKR